MIGDHRGRKTRCLRMGVSFKYIKNETTMSFDYKNVAIKQLKLIFILSED